MKKIVGCVTAVAAFMFIVSSCNLDSGTTNPQTGFFMVGQISPDAPHFNISINGATFDTGLAFGNYTPYVSANAGVYNFVFYPTGSSTPVINNSLNIEVNKTYSYYVIDSFSKVKAAVVQDVFTAPPGDSVYVRFFH